MKYRLPIALFFLLIIFSGTLGMTEDEAYYWVLSQKLSLGYAYHPPAVAWVIRLFEALFAPFVGKAVPWVTRLPAVLITALTLGVAMKWMSEAGAQKNRIESSTWILISFAGMFSVSWMIVPDLPFLMGWIICFYQIWKRSFSKKVYPLDDGLLFFGVVLSVLSKYTAVFILLSGFLCTLHFCDRRTFFKTAALLGLGALAGFLPNLIWNFQHHFGPLLYQISERHSGGHFILSRYLRFWALQFVLAGPLVIFSLSLFSEAKKKKNIERFAAIWVLPPALVFWIQPAFSDFKFHWTLISWFPVALVLALKYSKGEAVKIAKVQRGVGLSLLIIVAISFQFPVVATVLDRFEKRVEPKFDITNDVYGWNELALKFKTIAPSHVQNLPWVGSRYQTAALAAYTLRDATRVELIPRDEKSLDEWPLLNLTNAPGPEWPKIEKPFIFVTDNRFSNPPEFKSGDCAKSQSFEFFRGRYLAKTITLFYCKPY